MPLQFIFSITSPTEKNIFTSTQATRCTKCMALFLQQIFAYICCWLAAILNSGEMLKVDSVELNFNGRKILQGIYLDCKENEVVGLLGRNGCGKSSLLKIIFGTVNPTFKHISVDDLVIDKGYQHNQIAYLPQHHFLPNHLSVSKLAAVMIDSDYWDEFTELEIFQKNQHKKSAQLSGGELRQIETLLILYSSARYILLDEPFIHLSPIQAAEFKKIIRLRAKTKGIIVTNHQYRSILEISDRIFLLNNGYTNIIRETADLIEHGYINDLI
ncbi:MAG: ATP-binding cassette domain-containing protein [Sphingobacteriaceae bacterium]|nr:MAG: ATP-binding cassette domain-containing protein [Sphingobacteriaceae bacterium]